MIQSMTGYGKTEVCFANKKIHIEIKALNSKSLDLSTRISQIYRDKELDIRAFLTEHLKRGKIDCWIWIEKEAVFSTPEINEVAATSYINSIREISNRLELKINEENLWNALSRLPDITVAKEMDSISEEEWNVVFDGIKEAVHRLIEFRKQEGEALYHKFEENIANIRLLSQQLIPFEESRVDKIKQRLTQRLSELQPIDYDQNRLEQELIYYIEKLDINEEKQRLANHLNYFQSTMSSDEICLGKKLGFIAQEMGREINTTGSKSNEAEMQKIVVGMKDELEQIKEQVLNVL